MKLKEMTDEQVSIEIGAQLKKLRLELGFRNYQDFAEKVNVSRGQYFRIEKGQTNINIKSLKKILDFFEISLNEFFTLCNI